MARASILERIELFLLVTVTITGAVLLRLAYDVGTVLLWAALPVLRGINWLLDPHGHQD